MEPHRPNAIRVIAHDTAIPARTVTAPSVHPLSVSTDAKIPPADAAMISRIFTAGLLSIRPVRYRTKKSMEKLTRKSISAYTVIFPPPMQLYYTTTLLKIVSYKGANIIFPEKTGT